MAEVPGWKLKLYLDGVLIAGMRTKTLNDASEGIDITSDDDDGYQTFMALAGKKALNVSAEGVFKDDTILAKSLAGTDLIDTFKLEWAATGAFIESEFRLSNFSTVGETNGVVTYSFDLSSSGAYAYTPA